MIQKERETIIEKLELTLEATHVGVWDWDIKKIKYFGIKTSIIFLDMKKMRLKLPMKNGNLFYTFKINKRYIKVFKNN